jgi:hypothetical protein
VNDLLGDLADPAARPPDWRWRAAELAARSPRTGFAKALPSDAVVGLAAKFVRGLEAARQSRVAPSELASQARRLPGVYGAWSLRYRADPVPRDLLESQLLTGVSAAAAAAKGGLGRDVAAYYEKLFFDVRLRLDDAAYLARHVFATGDRARARMPAGLWKLGAWSGGEEVLKLLVAGGVARAGSETVEAAAKLQDFVRGLLAARALGATAALDVRRDARLVLQTYLGAGAFAGGAAQAVSPEGRRAMSLLEAFGLKVECGGPAEAPADLPHAEARCAEMMAEATGLPVAVKLAAGDLIYPEQEASPPA